MQAEFSRVLLRTARVPCLPSLQAPTFVYDCARGDHFNQGLCGANGISFTYKRQFLDATEGLWVLGFAWLRRQNPREC
jgi:hypothetical protein